MITDIHCHFVPDAFLRFVLAHDAFGLNLGARSGEDVHVSLNGLDVRLNTGFFDERKQIERMADLGIDRTVLSLATTFINYAIDPALAVCAAQTFNDALAELFTREPRFRGWAFLPLQDPEAAARELHRCVTTLGFVGGHVGSNVGGRHLYEDVFTPVHRAALDLDVPLFIHPADPAGKERMREFELTIVAGYLFDNTLNLLKMICSGFLDRWPKLKLVFAHTGAFGLLLRNRMQREVDTNPVLSASLARPVADYMRQLYFDTVCFEPDVLRFATGFIPLDHFMMGSDGPYLLGEAAPVSFVRAALPPAEAHEILHHNFDRLIASAP